MIFALTNAKMHKMSSNYIWKLPTSPTLLSTADTNQDQTVKYNRVTYPALNFHYNNQLYRISVASMYQITKKKQIIIHSRRLHYNDNNFWDNNTFLINYNRLWLIIFFLQIFDFFLVEINFKLNWWNNNIFVPTFDTKVTEYLCSGWVFFFFRQISTF